jgi:hypothetical protein
MNDPRRERIEELLADRALVGLTEPEERELERLLRETGRRPDQASDLAVAVLQAALAPVRAELPAALRARLSAAASAFRRGAH